MRCCARLSRPHLRLVSGHLSDWVCMRYAELLISTLADAILIGEYSVDGIAASAARCLGLDIEATFPLAKEIIDWLDFKSFPFHQRQFLMDWIHESEAFEFLNTQYNLRIRNWPLQKLVLPQLQIETGISRYGLPSFSDKTDLARWLNLAEPDLIWYSRFWRSDSKKLKGKMQHYHYQFETKRSGEIRLLESPKAHLKKIQRQLQQHLFSKIPLHQCAHGFVPARSTASFVQPHIGQAVVVALDLRHFFLSISSGRIYRMLEKLGFSRDVSMCIKGLCTNSVSEFVLEQISEPELRSFYRHEHLPQGAPTSPVLSNLAAFNLDARLYGVARSMGFNYSRYADDLAFSCDHFDKAQTNRLIHIINKIVSAEGFQLNTNKTRVMTQAQAQSLVGLVINEKLNIKRETVKQFEAELYNCVRNGPDSQNRSAIHHYQAHLAGKLAYFSQIGSIKSRRLATLFDRIKWSE